MKTLTGNNGRVLGYISEEWEKQFIHDAHYRRLGYYSSDFDATFLMNGNKYGDGNLLSMLLNEAG